MLKHPTTETSCRQYKMQSYLLKPVAACMSGPTRWLVIRKHNASPAAAEPGEAEPVHSGRSRCRADTSRWLGACLIHNTTKTPLTPKTAESHTGACSRPWAVCTKSQIWSAVTDTLAGNRVR